MVMELRTTKERQVATNTMTIQDTYTLLIAGAGNHSTQVTTCTAAATAGADKNVTIFPESGSTKVLADFTIPDPPSLNINGKKVNKMSTLTGFRLVGSNAVYLTCTITVCANPGCTAPTTSAGVKSKRKGGKHPTHTHYATLKLDVRDNLMETSSNGATDTFPSGGKMMKFIVLVTIMNFLY